MYPPGQEQTSKFAYLNYNLDTGFRYSGAVRPNRFLSLDGIAGQAMMGAILKHFGMSLFLDKPPQKDVIRNQDNH